MSPESCSGTYADGLRRAIEICREMMPSHEWDMTTDLYDEMVKKLVLDEVIAKCEREAYERPKAE